MIRNALLLLAVGALLTLPVQAQDMGLEDVLSKHYEASGGLEAMKAIESVKFTGVMHMAGFQSPFTRWAKRPAMVRLEFDVQGMKGIQAYDGETAWMYMPFMGQAAPEVMPADLAAQMKQEADMDGPLVDWKEKGHQVELIGMEQVEGSDCYKLEVTLNNGDVHNYFLDSEYFLAIRVVGSAMMSGVETNFQIDLSDYKEVASLMMPHSIAITGMQGPGTQTIIIDAVEVNIEIEDDEFRMQQ